MTEKNRNRDHALREVVDQVEKSHGKGAIMRLGSDAGTTPVPVIPSGAMALDQALGVGGFGRDDGRQALLGGLRLGMSRQQQRVGRADGAGQGVALAWGDRGCLHS